MGVTVASVRTAGRRWWWVVPVLGAYAYQLARTPAGHTDATIMRSAGDQLFSGSGLHLYAQHPEVQIGPVALLLSRALGYDRLTTTAPAGAFSVVLLVLVIAGLLRLVSFDCERAPSAAVKALALTPVGIVWWELLPATAHVDDAVSIAALVWAVVCVRRSRGVAAGLLLGVAIACKPWAAFGLVLLAAPGARRGTARRGVGCAAGMTALAWGPFLLADHATFGKLGSFVIPVSGDSIWSFFGYHHGPTWMRLLQLLVASAGGALVLRARRWDLLLAWVFGVRLFLDAQTFEYYLPELVAGLALADLVRGTRAPRLQDGRPILAAAAVAFLWWGAAPIMTDNAWERLGTIAVLVALAALPLPDPARSRPSVGPAAEPRGRELVLVGAD